MNYQKIYDNLIKKAKTENRKKVSVICENRVYYKNHHINPRCLGGLDTNDNLVLLTAKEHYMAHKLLMYIYPRKMGIIFAFKFMSKLYKNSSDYQYARELYNALPSSEKTKQKRLDAWLEINGSKEAISEYLKTLKGISYSPDYDKTIHVNLSENKKAQINIDIKEKLTAQYLIDTLYKAQNKLTKTFKTNIIFLEDNLRIFNIIAENPEKIKNLQIKYDSKFVLLSNRNSILSESKNIDDIIKVMKSYIRQS